MKYRTTNLALVLGAALVAQGGAFERADNSLLSKLEPVTRNYGITRTDSDNRVYAIFDNMDVGSLNRLVQYPESGNLSASAEDKDQLYGTLKDALNATRPNSSFVVEFRVGDGFSGVSNVYTPEGTALTKGAFRTGCYGGPSPTGQSIYFSMPGEEGKIQIWRPPQAPETEEEPVKESPRGWLGRIRKEHAGKRYKKPGHITLREAIEHAVEVDRRRRRGLPTGDGWSY